jgi:hypothetical protein
VSLTRPAASAKPGIGFNAPFCVIGAACAFDSKLQRNAATRTVRAGAQEPVR